MRARNAARREALLAALEEHLGGQVEIVGANAGLHLLARLPGIARARERELIERAREADVAMHSAAPFYLQSPERCELMLGYGALTERDIREGVRRLAGAVASIRGSQAANP
jgi:GntR family transcriptional regulator / MocR family aminotransferase